MPTRTFCGETSRWTRSDPLAAIVSRFVGGVEAVEHAAHDPHADERLHPLAAFSNGANELCEGGPPHVLHDEKHFAVGGHDVERRDHVRMCDARRQPGFVEEHLHEVRVARELGVESLDRDRTGESRGAEEPPEMDRGHAARRDLAVQHVTPEDPRCGGLQGDSHDS